MKKGGKNSEKGDIMFGGSCGNRFLMRITGRRIFTHIHESNPNFLGGDKSEERKIPCHGNFEGAI